MARGTERKKRTAQAFTELRKSIASDESLARERTGRTEAIKRIEDRILAERKSLYVKLR